MAKSRLQQSRRSMKKKGKLAEFEAAVAEYAEMGHSERVPEEEVQKLPYECCYLPMHGVVREASETTRLRIVFDASAKTSTGVSLNDTLLTGPSMYPPNLNPKQVHMAMQWAWLWIYPRCSVR